MAQFVIYSVPASKSQTDGIEFITVKIAVGANNATSERRVFEATKLDQIKAEVETQKAMIGEPSVVMITKLSGRAPAGFNDWNSLSKYFDPNEQAVA